MRKPNGSRGSIMHKNRAGDGTTSISVGTYAANMPSGVGRPRSRHFRADVSSKLAPAESPAVTTLSPV